jgi:DNA polymerase-3 subunit beta
MPSGQILFDMKEDTKVSLSCGSSEFDIQGIPSEQFPVMETDIDGSSFDLERTMLREMINRTAFSASLEEARGIITGVLCEIRKDKVSLVALDGFRMAITRENISGETEKNMIIPSRIMHEIGKILADVGGDGAGPVEIVAGDNKAKLVIDDTVAIVRLMEGVFIKYEDILPKENKITIKVDKNELFESIKRASIIVREGKNSFIRFKVDESGLVISSRADEGRSQDIIQIEKEGEDIEIGFNGRFVSDVLRVIDDEKIIMEMSTSISPCIIRPEEGDNYKYLILPVRLSTANI